MTRNQHRLSARDRVSRHHGVLIKGFFPIFRLVYTTHHVPALLSPVAIDASKVRVFVCTRVWTRFYHQPLIVHRTLRAADPVIECQSGSRIHPGGSDERRWPRSVPPAATTTTASSRHSHRCLSFFDWRLCTMHFSSAVSQCVLGAVVCSAALLKLLTASCSAEFTWSSGLLHCIQSLADLPDTFWDVCAGHRMARDAKNVFLPAAAVIASLMPVR